MTWLDRRLLVGPRLGFVTSQRQFAAMLRSLRIDDDDRYCDPNWHACLHAYDVDGELVCVAGVNLDRLAMLTPIDAAAVLVHEAVHVWQRVRDRMGPGDLGREMEAYAIQNIAALMMEAYVTSSSAAAA